MFVFSWLFWLPNLSCTLIFELILLSYTYLCILFWKRFSRLDRFETVGVQGEWKFFVLLDLNMLLTTKLVQFYFIILFFKNIVIWWPDYFHLENQNGRNFPAKVLSKKVLNPSVNIGLIFWNSNSNRPENLKDIQKSGSFGDCLKNN